MKKCSYCGHQNADDREFCEGCAEPIVVEVSPAKSLPTIKAQHSQAVESVPCASNMLSAGFFEDAKPLDLSLIDMGFSFDEGFSRPDWARIQQGIKNNFPEESWGQVWREVGIKWLNQLCDDLGGNYNWYESWNFFLLSAESKENSEEILELAENVIGSIQAILGSINCERALYGKRVILVFSEEDDYYSYISYFYPEGHHSRSAGVFISKNYGHIALHFEGMSEVANVVTHELTHNYLWGLNLPIWLNEGLCKRLERELIRRVGTRTMLAKAPVLTADLAEEHHAFWNEEKIHEFWAGTSFYQPDRGNALSYNLGEILVELMSEKWGDFLDFVSNADYRDAGQDAALKYLGRSLGDVAGTFLGPGDWRPDRKAIAELWALEKQKESGQ